jgi:phosphoenolpyruvate carboxykinase (ATP)
MSEYGLWEQLSIRSAGTVFWNLTTPMLYEQAIKHREAEIVHMGPLVTRTGKHTGRSPNDKFIVK